MSRCRQKKILEKRRLVLTHTKHEPHNRVINNQNFFRKKKQNPPLSLLKTPHFYFNCLYHNEHLSPHKVSTYRKQK